MTDTVVAINNWVVIDGKQASIVIQGHESLVLRISELIRFWANTTVKVEAEVRSA